MMWFSSGRPAVHQAVKLIAGEQSKRPGKTGCAIETGVRGDEARSSTRDLSTSALVEYWEDSEPPAETECGNLTFFVERRDGVS